MYGYSEVKERRIRVFRDTLERIEENEELQKKGKCTVYTRIEPLRGSFERHDTLIRVVNDDCLNVARSLLVKGDRVGVLNMASFRRPGGGVQSGAGAQEENLCRRSNLYSYISEAEGAYPMKAGSFSSDVCVFKDGEPDYRLCRPYFVDIISAAAIARPELVGGRLNEKDERFTRNAMRNIFRMAAIGGDERLVLSAFGCGAFHNPPEQIAELFGSVLEEGEFRGRFKEVVFAIIDDHNAAAGGNYKPFAMYFGRK